METNEIMTNEEVTEAVETAAEEIITKSSGNDRLKAAAVGGLAVLIGGLALQYIIIPAAAKIKAKKKNSDVVDSEGSYVDEEVVDSDDSDGDFKEVE